MSDAYVYIDGKPVGLCRAEEVTIEYYYDPDAEARWRRFVADPVAWIREAAGEIWARHLMDGRFFQELTKSANGFTLAARQAAFEFEQFGARLRTIQAGDPARLDAFRSSCAPRVPAPPPWNPPVAKRQRRRR